MITETEIVARFTRLDRQMLGRWIAIGWLKPRPSAGGFVFDDADVARAHLICDLSYDMELGEEELAMVLSLLDQLHGTRTLLRAMTSAVQSQSEDVRDAIRLNMQQALSQDPDADSL
jgi:chaperone modulatory protein CbpM